MKKVLSLVFFLLSGSSLLLANNDLEDILNRSDPNLHLRIEHAVKKQIARVLEAFEENYSVEGEGARYYKPLRQQYELQYKILEQIISKIEEYHGASASAPASSSTSNGLNFSDEVSDYLTAKSEIARLKNELLPLERMLLQVKFASLPIEGRTTNSVKYSIALKENSRQALHVFKTEFHAHDYHQFIEWRNYAFYLERFAQEHVSDPAKLKEYLMAALRIYKKLLPYTEERYALLKGQNLPAYLFDKRSNSTGELASLWKTEEMLEDAYYLAGKLARSLGHTELALNYLILTKRLAKENKSVLLRLEFVLARAWREYAQQKNDERFYHNAVQSFSRYFASNPKDIYLDYYILAADTALLADNFEKASIWLQKVIDTLRVTKESEHLTFTGCFSRTARELATRAYKEEDYDTALYFTESIVQNDAILNQATLNRSIQFYNAGTMAYLSKNFEKAKHYLSSVDLADPQVANNASTVSTVKLYLDIINKELNKE